ncbi:MAG: biosynthetic-type acetolactate synthase large subunit, partial [Clostridiales bacterium]|nr:biosynthetic-type acetolactate synthase large subunit [Clostridiales bacterium]
EQGAAHAADGYARASGKTGVVFATSGPGATNLVTGIANAYLDSVPLVAITGNVSVPLLGRDSFQEVDIVAITQPVVKHSFMVRNIDELEHILNEAFRIARTGRHGPVLVDVPKNVQTDTAEYTGALPAPRGAAPAGDAPERALEAIRGAKRPCIYAGGGVLASGAETELLMLSERINAPVALSMMGLTALPSDCELNLGMCGMHGKYAATAASAECDVLIALGVRFSDRATGDTDEYRRGRTVIHFDVDSAEIGKNVESDISVCGDIKASLQWLLKELPGARNDEWLARIDELKAIGSGAEREDFAPRRIIEAVRRKYPEAVVATDVGQHQMWVMQYCRFSKPGTLLTSGGLGTMGYGLGAAIGGCIANGKARTVLFTSEGSFGMNLIELATAVTYNLPITVVILNNGVLGMVRQWQTMFFEKRYSHTTLNRSTDFKALAESFGAVGFLANSAAELEAALESVPDGGPSVIDCRIDMDEMVLPMIPAGGTINDIIL